MKSVLNTCFMSLPLTLEHLNYYRNTTKIDTETMSLSKSDLINYLQIILFPLTQPLN